MSTSRRLSRLPGWLLSLLLFACSLAVAEQPIPPLAAHVTDLTGTLAGDQEATLDAKLAAFEREKGSQIAVLIVATVRPESIEQYALRVVEAWKLGRQGIDDGALLLVAKDDRRMRIEVGYGLEGALNDATAKRIISETIAPHFKQGGFYAGVDAGVDAMLKVVAGEPLPAPDEQGRGPAEVGASFETVLVAGGILVLIVAGAVRAILVLRAIFGRFLAAGIVAVGAGVIASLMFSSLLVALLIGVLAFLLALVVDMSGVSGAFSSGGSWGGGRRRGGSGGFSGGGGGFGGGGASGGW